MEVRVPCSSFPSAAAAGRSPAGAGWVTALVTARRCSRSAGFEASHPEIIRSRAHPATRPRPVLNTDRTSQAGATSGPWVPTGCAKALITLRLR